MGLEGALAWKTCTFGKFDKLNNFIYKTTIDLFQMNRDNSGNSIDLILVDKFPLSVIRLWKRRNNTVNEPY